MSKESFEQKMTECASKIENVLESFASINWIDFVSKVLIFSDDKSYELYIIYFKVNYFGVNYYEC